MTIVTVEVQAAINSGGTLQSFYFSDSPNFMSLGTDTPADTFFYPHLKEPGKIGVKVWSEGKTYGKSQLEVGQITVVNNDGRYDAFADYGWDGRPIIIRYGDGPSYPTNFTTLFSGTIDYVRCDENLITFFVRDKAFILDKILSSATYLGTNALPNGVEGVPTDIKGQRKPKCYGAVYNVPPPCVNTSKLTYQVNNGAVTDIPAVYVRGVSLTKGADYATSALMHAAASPAAGNYYTCFAEGMFRLASVDGLVTADVLEGANAAARTVAQVLKRIALDAGVAGGDIDAGDVTALDTACNYVVGVYCRDQKALEAMDMVSASIGAYFFFDGAGVLRMGRLTAPAGGGPQILQIYIRQKYSRAAALDKGIPAWSMTMGYMRFFEPQSSDVAASVSAVRRSDLSNAYRYARSDNSGILLRFLLASELKFEGLLTVEANAQSEAARQLALYEVRRDIFTIEIPLAIYNSLQPTLMTSVRAYVDRYGRTGYDFRVIGVSFELSRGRVILTLWG